MNALYELAAPAKLNLFLHVVGRRPDGYHLLQSVFVMIDWCDTLHVEKRGDARLQRHDLGAELPADDLCLRAARLLQQRSTGSLGADISIEKRVPWGAGLGGGSSDAATTLLALNRLWDLNWPLSELAKIGLELGADVPFFLGGRPAWVEGVGERLTPIDVPAATFAVVKPPSPIETRAIFQSPRLVRDTPTAILAGLLADHGPEGFAQRLLQGHGRNDLQPPAESHCAEVVQAAALLKARFGNSRMTGSGSAVFAIVDAAEPAALRAPAGKRTAGPTTAATLPDLPAGWVGRVCRSLDLHPLQGWASN